MSGWRTARLEEVAEVLGGGTPSRQESSFFGGAIPWATPTDITKLEGLYIDRTKETITDEGLRNSSTKLIPAGAVLLTSRATIGFTAVSRVPICTNQGFVNFVCGPDLVPEFLAFWLRTQKPKLIQHAGGTTFKEIARGTVRKFEISFPPLAEQHRIVDLLSRAEGIVRLRREAQKKAAELIPALFLEMFGDPATNPKGWPVRRVSDFVARFVGGKNLQAGSENPSGFRILKVSAATSGIYRESESKPTPDNYTPPKNHLVCKGDLLFSRANTEELVGATAIVEESNGKTLLPDKLWRFVWSEPVEPLYIHALFQNAHIRQELGKLSSGTSASMRNISQAKLFAMTLAVAPIENQRVFAESVRSIRSIQMQQAAATQKAKAAFNALLSSVFQG
jgi:type I restriction enzyme S subunit